jgi:hypothetical protein
MKKWILIATLAAVAGYGSIAFADSGASELPPNWHVHDGQTALGPQHKPASFFPAILSQSLADYLADPARCPDATDKSLLPSAGESQRDLLRAGVCMTSTTIIQLRTVPVGTSGPEGWQSRIGPEAGYVTYYSLTPR